MTDEQKAGVDEEQDGNYYSAKNKHLFPSFKQASIVAFQQRRKLNFRNCRDTLSWAGQMLQCRTSS